MPKMILVVDDEPEITGGLETLLRGAGYAVTTAGDGEAALAQVASARPDLIILDLLLPKLDGWRVCQQLKQDPATHQIPCLLLSGLIREPSGKEAQYLEDAMLPKPCESETLLAKVRELLG